MTRPNPLHFIVAPIVGAAIVGAAMFAAACEMPAYAGQGTDAPIMHATFPPLMAETQVPPTPRSGPPNVSFTEDGPVIQPELPPLLPQGVYRSPCEEDEVLYPVDPHTGVLAFPEGVLVCVHIDRFED
jgi:hypothetical protein